MNTLVILGLLTFVCLLGHNSAGPLGPQLLFREGCCTIHKRLEVPAAKIKHVAMAPSDCKLKAIIITAASGKKFCSDPTWSWAKRQLEVFQNSTNHPNTKH